MLYKIMYLIFRFIHSQWPEIMLFLMINGILGSLIQKTTPELGDVNFILMIFVFLIYQLGLMFVCAIAGAFAVYVGSEAIERPSDNALMAAIATALMVIVNFITRLLFEISVPWHLTIAAAVGTIPLLIVLDWTINTFKLVFVRRKKEGLDGHTP